jgi:hypothetical protein
MIRLAYEQYLKPLFSFPVKDEDSDCEGDTTMCLFYKCSNEFGLMDNDCVCRTGQDCDSGRCEGVIPYPMCQARLANGGSCDEDSDCISNFCSWNFVCEKLEKGNVFIDWLIWSLIVIAGLGILYGLYRLCCGKGRDGYTEVSGDDNDM